MTDISALKKAVKIVADVVNDSIDAADEKTALEKILKYQNIIGDFVSLVPEIGDIPEELKNADSEAYAALVAELSADLILPVGKTQAIVQASFKLLTNIAVHVVPEVKAIIAAAKAA